MCTKSCTAKTSSKMYMKPQNRAARINQNYARLRDAGTKAINLAIDIGLDLQLAKAERPHGEFGDWVAKNLDLKPNQVQKYLRIGAHKAQVRAIVADEDAPTSIDELVKLLPRANEEPIVTEADPDQLGYAGVSAHNKKTRDSDDWHTPGEYVDDAREVMGSINLDPFSSLEANEFVQADRVLTLADDALITPWADPKTRTVWMNPPYGRGMMTKAIARFLDQYNQGAFEQAVVLTNAATDTYWYHDMLKASVAVCQTLGRIAFISGDKELSGNTKGQAFFYFGLTHDKFRATFSKHGWATSTESYR